MINEKNYKPLYIFVGLVVLGTFIFTPDNSNGEKKDKIYAEKETSNFYNKTTDIKKIAWMDRGKDSIKQLVKDPLSVQFKEIILVKIVRNYLL